MANIHYLLIHTVHWAAQPTIHGIFDSVDAAILYAKQNAGRRRLPARKRVPKEGTWVQAWHGGELVGEFDLDGEEFEDD